MQSYNIICPYFLKKRIISSLDPSDRVKFYSLEDVERFLLPNFSEKAIEFVYYNYAEKNLSYALTLLNSMKYVKSVTHSAKTDLLRNIYRDLQEEGLLEFDEISKIIFKKNPSKIIGYSDCVGFLQLLKDSKIDFELAPIDTYISIAGKVVHSFPNKREELIQAVNTVAELLQSGIDYSQICVVCPPSDMSFLKLIGKDSNVIFANDDIDLNVNLLSNRALTLLESGNTDEFIKLVKEEKDSEETETDLDALVRTKLWNTYNKLRDKNLSDDFLPKYFKYLITSSSFSSQKGIALVSSLDKAASYSHVILINFDESYPRTFKNSDYLFDQIKKQDTYMEQSVNLNHFERTKLLLLLSNIEELYISVSENDEIAGKVYRSCLIEEEGMKLINYDYKSGNRYTYSFDQLDYAILNADYLDYGVSSKYYLLLEDIFKDTYVKYQPNDAKITCEFDTSKLHFSYSSMTTYAKCPFRYLIEKVYRINDSKYDPINLDIGTFCHYFLERYVNGEEISFEENLKVLERDIDSYSVKDRFYLRKAYKEIRDFSTYLHEFIDAIGDSKKFYTERKFNVKLQDKYDMTGIIDLMVEDAEGFLIFDYKTGSHKLDQNDVINGFDMQLPFYNYVASKKLLPRKKPYGMYYITTLQPDSISKYYDSFKFSGMNLNVKDFLSHVSEPDVVKKYISSRSQAILPYREMIQKMLEKIDEIIKGVNSFEFPVTKKVYVRLDGSWKKSQCEYCNYRDVCFVDDNSKQVVEIKEIQKEKKAEDE